MLGHRTPRTSFARPRLSVLKSQSKSKTKKATGESVKVAIRIRPLGSNSSNENLIRAFRAGNNSVIEDSKREYNYDYVFGEEADTTQIYSELVKDIVSSVSNDGLNSTIFTYGQTSSGKTFTMQGIHDTEGLIQYAGRDIFKTIEQQRNINSESAVKLSYVEIYNDELRDLLSDKRKSNPSSLVIREDMKGVIAIENLKQVAVRNLDQLMQVFRVGEANKSMGSTKMNDRSSRSHAILQITVEKKTAFNAPSEDCSDEKENNELASPKKNSLVVKTSSTLNLVDLAGSESVRLTGATGQQKKEGGMINQSLLTLSKVLMSLGQKTPCHVNYRDSKLTRILKPSLSGNARMAVICCISPSDNYIDETRSTLQFATRAKLVKTSATTNEMIQSHADVIAKLRLDLEQAKLANERLEIQNQELKLAASGSATTQAERIELDNLKRFLFDDSQRNGGERLSSERKGKIKKMVVLQKQVERSCVDDEMKVLLDRFEASEKALAAKSRELEDAYCAHNNEKDCMMEEIDTLRKKVQELDTTASRNDSQEYHSIKQENTGLKSELQSFQAQLEAAGQSIIDRDNESMHMEETIAELSEKLKEARQRAKKAEGAALKKQNTVDNEFRQMDDNVVGSRVAKFFNSELYFGTVTSLNIFYRIAYDDGDEEDLDEEDVHRALNLYATNKKDAVDLINNHPISENQNVWVRIGKHEHPATVMSIGNQIATVKWSATNKLDEVDLHAIAPMFVDDSRSPGHSRRSMRTRRQTKRYLSD